MQLTTIRLTSIVIAGLVACLQIESFAQDSSVATTNKPTIESFEWIAGNWQGEAMGGSFEESWNLASGGAMMGMFKFVDDGEVNFYEILTIVPSDDSFVLRLKHFDAGLKGWEEKDKSIEFPLVSVSPTEAKFEGLVFSKIAPDRMNIVVQTKTGEQTQELNFECHRRVVNTSKSPAHDQTTFRIQQVLAMDAVLAKQRDKLPKTQPIAVAIESYVIGLQALDFSDCPRDFSDHFLRHCSAWKGSLQFFGKHGELRGEMSDVIKQIRKLGPGTVAELDAQMAPIMETWKEIEKAAAEFQAK